MDYYFFVFSCLFASVLTLPTPRPKHRSDYKYNPKTDAYYKLHRDPKLVSEAEAACKAEGAELIIPYSEKDLHQVFVLLIQHGIGSSVWIGKEEKNMECHVITRDMDVGAVECTGQLPFVCKVTAEELNHNKECKDQGYHYYPETGSCYKVPHYATNWHKALVDCQNENAHLVVLNSEEEAKTIKSFLKTVPRVPNAVNDLYFYAGFKAENLTREFRTIYGKTLEENGYVGWSEYEPNNWSGMEYCGSVVRETGMNNDIVCDWDFGFICEKDITSPKIIINTPSETDSSIIIPLLTTERATEDSEANDLRHKLTTRSTKTNDLNLKLAIPSSEINNLNHVKAVETKNLIPKILDFNPTMVEEAPDTYIYVENTLGTSVSEINDLSTKMVTKASEKLDLILEITTKASEENNLGLEMTKQAGETNDFTPEMVKLASETNDLNNEMATKASEKNDLSLKMEIKASETDNLSHEITTQASDINIFVENTLPTQASETNDLSTRWATRVLESNNLIPKIAIQTSETNYLSHKMVTTTSETNLDHESATKASEKNDLSIEIPTQILDTKESSSNMQMSDTLFVDPILLETVL